MFTIRRPFTIHKISPLTLYVVCTTFGFVPSELMTTTQVAKVFEVTIQTVGTWVREGKLEAFRTPGGRIRVRREDVEAFLASRAPDKAAS